MFLQQDSTFQLRNSHSLEIKSLQNDISRLQKDLLTGEKALEQMDCLKLQVSNSCIRAREVESEISQKEKEILCLREQQCVSDEIVDKQKEVEIRNVDRIRMLEGKVVALQQQHSLHLEKVEVKHELVLQKVQSEKTKLEGVCGALQKTIQNVVANKDLKIKK